MSLPRRTLPLMAIALLAGCAGRAIHRGESYEASGQAAAAERTYLRAITRFPRNGSIQLHLAHLLLELDRPAEAVPPARAALDANEEGAEVLLATALLESGETSAALDIVERGLLRHPDDPDYLVLKARIRLLKSDPDGALALLDRATELRPDMPTLAYKAWMSIRAGRPADAQEPADQAIGQRGDDIEALCDLTAAYAIIGDSRGHGDALSRLLTASPVQASDFLHRSIRRKEAGDVESALRYAAWAVGLDPGQGENLRMLGLLAVQVGLSELGVRYLQEALAAPPFRFDLHPGRSAVSVRGATAPTEEIVVMLRALAHGWGQLGRKDQAAWVTEEIALVTRREDPQAWILVAQAWLDADAPERALGSLQRVFKADSRNATGHLLAARALLLLGQTEMAMGNARVAVDAEPGSLPFALFLGQLYEALDRKELAREVYRRALDYHPDDRSLLARLGALQ